MGPRSFPRRIPSDADPSPPNPPEGILRASRSRFGVKHRPALCPHAPGVAKTLPRQVRERHRPRVEGGVSRGDERTAREAGDRGVQAQVAM